MEYQKVFERYEIKFLLSENQKESLLRVMRPFMEPDQYGKSSVRNIYFDTEDYRLIRHSLEKPAYKEKFRVRSYGCVKAEDMVFAELKKKYNSIVYKRRITLPERDAMSWACSAGFHPEQSQISSEMEYFFRFYQTLRPAAFISYDREAYCASAGDDLRITFDTSLLYRRTALCLGSEVWGTPLLPVGQVLMEVKTTGGLPLWLVHFLSQNRIYKTSFSKYGAAYVQWQTGEGRGGLYA